VPFFEMLEIKMVTNVSDEQKRAIPKHCEEIFSALYDETETVFTGCQTGSVVLTVWRRIGRDAILRGRVWRLWRATLAATRPGIAF
jgi:hypothetical protein